MGATTKAIRSSALTPTVDSVLRSAVQAVSCCEHDVQLLAWQLQKYIGTTPHPSSGAGLIGVAGAVMVKFCLCLLFLFQPFSCSGNYPTLIPSS